MKSDIHYHIYSIKCSIKHVRVVLKGRSSWTFRHSTKEAFLEYSGIDVDKGTVPYYIEGKSVYDFN